MVVPSSFRAVALRPLAARRVAAVLQLRVLGLAIELDQLTPFRRVSSMVGRMLGGFLKALDVLGRELRPLDRQRQLDKRAGEREGHLVVLGRALGSIDQSLAPAVFCFLIACMTCSRL
jgi:hypothetical protein